MHFRTAKPISITHPTTSDNIQKTPGHATYMRQKNPNKDWHLNPHRQNAQETPKQRPTLQIKPIIITKK